MTERMTDQEIDGIAAYDPLKEQAKSANALQVELDAMKKEYVALKHDIARYVNICSEQANDLANRDKFFTETAAQQMPVRASAGISADTAGAAHSPPREINTSAVAAAPAQTVSVPLHKMVGDLARELYYMLDDSEERADGDILVDSDGFAKVVAATEMIEANTEAQPGYVSTWPNNIRYAVERLELSYAAPDERAKRLADCLNHAVTELSRAAYSEEFDSEDCTNCIEKIKDTLRPMGITTDRELVESIYYRLCAACGVDNGDEIDILPIVEQKLGELAAYRSRK
jgi:hypothetical protein